MMSEGGKPVRSQTEIEHLLKAVDAFDRKLVVVSPDFEVLAANRHAMNLVNAGGLVGRKCHEALYGRKQHCENCPVTEVTETVRPGPKRAEGFTLGAEEGSCLYSLPVVTNGKLSSLLVLDLNVPALGGLEAMLRRSNSFLKNLILSSVDGVIAADMTGRILIFNEAAEKISGYTTVEALQQLHIRDVYPGDGARMIMRKLRSEEYGGKGKLKSLMVQVVRKDGETLPIRLNASIVYENGKEVATIGFFRDMREEVLMKKELEKTQIQLLQAEKMSSLGKLAAGVAHQLNNPLGGIVLFTQLIMEEYALQDNLKSDLLRILEDAQRCRDIVKELLEFTRQTRQDIRPHDINRALTRTLFLLENQAIFQNIKIEKNLSPALPEVEVDIQQINHIFMNIILNAAEAMEGKGTLSLATRPSPDGKSVAVEIADTGPGIPPEVLPHIFEPFFTTKDPGKGTGLGLSLAYGIVTAHRGRLSARSEPGQGTAFVIELPIGSVRSKTGD